MQYFINTYLKVSIKYRYLVKVLHLKLRKVIRAPYFDSDGVKICIKKRKSDKSRKEKHWDPRQDMKVRKWLLSSLSHPHVIWWHSAHTQSHQSTTQLCLSAIFLNYFIHLNTKLKKIREIPKTDSIVTHDAIIVLLVLHNTSMLLLLLRYCFFWWPFCLLWLVCIIHHSIPTWS